MPEKRTLCGFVAETGVSIFFRPDSADAVCIKYLGLWPGITNFLIRRIIYHIAGKMFLM
jgi:hypothetical protein